MALHDFHSEVLMFLVACANPHQDSAVADLVFVVFLVVFADTPRENRSDDSGWTATNCYGRN